MLFRSGLGTERDDGGLGDASTEVVDLVTNPLVMVSLPIPGTSYARLLKQSHVIFDALRRLLAEKRGQADRGTDALALIVNARDADGSALSEDEVLGEAATLYIAGHDTQAKTLAWTLWLLEQHPAVMADLVDEVTGTLGDRLPTVEDLPRLALTDRVLKESMRLLTTVPRLFPRTVASDTTLGGHPSPRVRPSSSVPGSPIAIPPSTPIPTAS